MREKKGTLMLNNLIKQQEEMMLENYVLANRDLFLLFKDIEKRLEGEEEHTDTLSESLVIVYNILSIGQYIIPNVIKSDINWFINIFNQEFEHELIRIDTHPNMENLLLVKVGDERTDVLSIGITPSLEPSRFKMFVIDPQGKELGKYNTSQVVYKEIIRTDIYRYLENLTQVIIKELGSSFPIINKMDQILTIYKEKDLEV
ncbi:MAG: hypothetical protein M0R77_00775 [Gammaproteobacteria bacterium]|nr:hypothetical protein [Acholeplasmataceae bacterium]MCK9529088.1 hypothetical protein [Gammaproteobacteria bacterium]